MLRWLVCLPFSALLIPKRAVVGARQALPSIYLPHLYPGFPIGHLIAIQSALSLRDQIFKRA